MRIALVHPYAWPEVRRGGERYFDDIATYLLEAGHDVELIAGGSTPSTEPRAGGGVIHRRRHRGSRIRHRTGLTETDLWGVNAFPSLVRHRYDVVHALVPSAAVAARLARQPTVYTILGHPTAEQLRGQPGNTRVMRAAIRMSTQVTALASGAANETAVLFGRRPVVLAPGVRLDRFTFVRTPRVGAPSVLYASDLGVRRKGLDVLLAAVALLLPKRPDLRLTLAGPGDAGWAFDALSEADREAVRAATDVAGAGDPDELPRRYADASVTVLPARDEAFGLVLVESLATGTPVVGCLGSGMDDIVDSVEVGRLVRFGDAAALARALDETIDLAANETTPTACRAAAARFGWVENIGAEHLAVYRAAVSGDR
jgi:phosphatidyl-myo-inositol alpha-mannosyltransferase